MSDKVLPRSYDYSPSIIIEYCYIKHLRYLEFHLTKSTKKGRDELTPH